MTISDFKKKIKAPIVWGNLLAMMLVIVAICFALWFGLASYTRHGEKIEVPEVTGLLLSNGSYTLEEMGLMAIIVDSGYNRSLPPGIILEQNPTAGSYVKSGREIYLTVNASSSPLLTLPDIADNCSKREAEARLTGLGFKLGPTEYVAGDQDWVISVKCRGRVVVHGDKIPSEAPLTLVVGLGKGGEFDNDSTETDSEFEEW